MTLGKDGERHLLLRGGEPDEVRGAGIEFGDNRKVFEAINDIAMMIDEIDPHHPTTTALAGFDANLASS